ncbi:hypothetical protein [Thiohalobacter thiocyanaticus]|uniref:Secreted protein n=1 Tax=Thiohalobacter thiocyanaticus TaxID=585455 RepID=A0A426QIW0_9GAMM|nr:hypothetical protein [Thiohalobacter thiocyanaticus]RRQ21704.1 hypothetical protein D6C00_06910 [Thiohalobacter thiocyanaticus]
MRKHRRSTTLSLVGVLLAGWLSLACGHCWALAETPVAGDGHCQHEPPVESEADCCGHGHEGPVCPQVQVDSVPVSETAVLPAVGSPDLPLALPAADLPWQPWRSPPSLPAAATAFPTSPPLYLRHCAFLK